MHPMGWERAIASGRTYLLLTFAAAIALAAVFVLRHTSDHQAAAGSIHWLENPRALAQITLTDHQNRPWSTDKLRGQWTLLYFGYTRCPDVCPITMGVLSRAVHQLKEATGSRPRVVLVSVDPKRDSPAALKRYVRYFHPGFIGLTGDAAAIGELAASVGIRAHPGNEDHRIADHDTRLALIDEKARLAGHIIPPLTFNSVIDAFHEIHRAQENEFMAMSTLGTPASWLDTLTVSVQRILPHHALSRLVHWLTRLEKPAALKNLAIRGFAALYDVDLSDASHREPSAYRSFNEFFARPLKDGARPLEEGSDLVSSPVDGTVSQVGTLDGARILQAKGHWYRVDELLGGLPHAKQFIGGRFATIYLAPHNYHRIHMPVDGRLVAMAHVPGRLFMVNPATAESLPGLFTRNERVAAVFETDNGPMAVVMVGALLVGSIETVWAGEVTPPTSDHPTHFDYGERLPPIELRRGEELGRFNMGSTVIVLFGPGQTAWKPNLAPGIPLRMGQTIGRLVTPPRV